MSMAPEGMLGPIQIIPNRGAHTQIKVTQKQIETLVVLGLVTYDPDYGPNANVYRPFLRADAEKVRSWIGE